MVVVVVVIVVVVVVSALASLHELTTTILLTNDRGQKKKLQIFIESTLMSQKFVRSSTKFMVNFLKFRAFCR